MGSCCSAEPKTEGAHIDFGEGVMGTRDASLNETIPAWKRKKGDEELFTVTESEKALDETRKERKRRNKESRRQQRLQPSAASSRKNEEESKKRVATQDIGTTSINGASRSPDSEGEETDHLEKGNVMAGIIPPPVGKSATISAVKVLPAPLVMQVAESAPRPPPLAAEPAVVEVKEEVKKPTKRGKKRNLFFIPEN